MAIDIYQRAIDRLRKRREENPYIQTAQFQVSQLAPEFRGLQRGLSAGLRRGDVSPGAKVQATQEVGTQYKRAIGGIYGQMEAKDRERVDQLNQQIDELEFRKDIAEEQKAEEKKKLEDQKKKMLWKVGGAVVGAGAGLAFGQPMLGAKFGVGAGELAGAGVGEEMDAGMIYEGMTDILSGISEAGTLKIQSDLSTIMSDVNKRFEGMSSQEIRNLYIGALPFMNDPKRLLEYYRNFLGQNTIPQGSFEYNYMNTIG